MKSLLLLIVAVIYGVLLLLKVGTPLRAQQNRLQIQATATTGENESVTAVCDAGNGVMVYVLHGATYGPGYGGITSVPNGCAKK